MKFLVLKKRSLIIAAVAIVLIVGLVLLVVFTRSSGVFLNESPRNQPLNELACGTNRVALTIDASFGAENTEEILQVLEQHDVRATFFMTGDWAKNHSDTARLLADSGRVELGSLGDSKENLSRASRRSARANIESSVERIKEASGGVEVGLFRAPFGEYSDRVLRASSDLNLSTIGFSVSDDGFENLSSYEMATAVVAGAEAGSIIRLQNNARHTPAALGAIIQGLENRGLRVGAVGDLV